MNIEFTGCITKNKDIFNTIIDGEHILHNKKNEYINLFAAFDIYFINGINITSINFTSLDDDEKKDEDSKNNRLSYLHSAIKVLDLNSVISGKKLHFNIISKKFNTPLIIFSIFILIKYKISYKFIFTKFRFNNR